MLNCSLKSVMITGIHNLLTFLHIGNVNVYNKYVPNLKLSTFFHELFNVFSLFSFLYKVALILNTHITFVIKTQYIFFFTVTI